MLSFSIYCFFYTIAAPIRRLNLVIDPNELSPPLRAWYVLPRDGIEPWVLYCLTTALVFITLAFARAECDWGRMRRWVSKLTAYLLAPALFATLLVRPPPLAGIPDSPVTLVAMMAIGAIIWWGLLRVRARNNRVFLVIFVAALFPLCLTATSALSVFDYNFILAPALRMLNGVELANIYTQYDLLLSLIALPFLVTGADPNGVQVLFQLSYLLFFLGVYLLANSLFSRDGLAVHLVLTLIIVRFFALQYDPTFAFQLTPLRLDLWLLPLALVWRYGAYHWSVGLCIGILEVLHRNFGSIYFAAYLLLIFVCGMDALYRRKIARKGDHWQADVQQILRDSGAALILPVLGFIAAMTIFGDHGMSAAGKLYSSFGFGFEPINRSSFYWNALALISFAVLLLFNLREMLEEKYFSTVAFLIFLVIGNSLYFFGRSHESNILAISGSITFLLFAVFDCLSTCFKGSLSVSNGTRRFIKVLPLLAVVMSSLYYSRSIVTKLEVQYENLVSGELRPSPTYSVDLEKINKITGSSRKVFPMLFADDFHFYYRGGYFPLAYWFPYAAWVFKGQQVEFLQSLLDDGYYLVYDFSSENYTEGQKEILSSLKFTNNIPVGDYGVVQRIVGK